MKRTHYTLFLFSLIFINSVYAQNPDSAVVPMRPKFGKYMDTTNRQLIIRYKEKEMAFNSRGTFQFVRHLPGNMWQMIKSPVQKSNLKGLAFVAVSTAILLPFDQVLIDNVRQISRDIHLSDETDYGIPVRIGTTKIIKYPKNINSALYQMGEGGTSMALACGLWIYGKIKKDYRAVQTAGDLAETFIIMGVSTQILKRISGRQSPFMATAKGGVWHPFPSFKEFQTNTSNYDAFPSGHLATMMATVTVLSENYPEKKWIRPVGYSIMGLTAWAMMNTQVHWISDYPLALALGYLSGKISTMRHMKKTNLKSAGL
ncbi:MAG: phosphatase PAP2 family protein [Bacteroidetes bacterium]|nr:phosphatase PAP2 family protein [Bacteroidota bacterium]MBS1931835.1 phosphatase PAP2 family protein [Bacteroidota bacterium]